MYKSKAYFILFLAKLAYLHVQKQRFYPILKHIIDVLRMRNSIVKI